MTWFLMWVPGLGLGFRFSLKLICDGLGDFDGKGLSNLSHFLPTPSKLDKSGSVHTQTSSKLGRITWNDSIYMDKYI